MLVIKRVAVRESRALAAGSNLGPSSAASCMASGHLPTSAVLVRAAHSAGGVAATAAPSPGHHQRRHSSSKPSSPPSDDSMAAPAPEKQSSPAGSSSRNSSSSTANSNPARKRATRRSAKEKDTAAKKALPSVPSTQHLDAQAVNLASFFSLHRPISVTAPVPAPANAASFASIFQPNPQRRVNDTLLTLASAVRALDRATGTGGAGAEDSDLRAAVTQASSSNAEDADADPVLVVSMQDLAHNFRPFHPPPPPTLPPAAAAAAATASTAEVNGPPRTRRRAASAASATAAIAATSRLRQPSRAVRATLPPYAQRVRARRQRRWLVSPVARHAAIWHAISTRRRRQLKMKKHKYKKLQKRLRNERRRLDRL